MAIYLHNLHTYTDHHCLTVSYRLQAHTGCLQCAVRNCPGLSELLLQELCGELLPSSKAGLPQRSREKGDLGVRRTKTRYGGALSSQLPVSSAPSLLRYALPSRSRCSRLKTYLFTMAYSDWCFSSIF